MKRINNFINSIQEDKKAHGFAGLSYLSHKF
jgi:hypothetical protein